MNKLLEGKQKKRRIIAGGMWDLLPVGEEILDFSTKKLLDTLGLDFPPGTIKDYTLEMEKLGWISRRFDYGYKSNGQAIGRHYHWTLLISKEEMLSRLADLEKQEMTRKPRPIVKKIGIELPPEPTSDKDNGAAIVAASGPERNSAFEALRSIRKDESFALVAAARQYSERTHTLDSSVSALVKQAADLGVKIDVDALRSSMTIEHDDRLETVSLVLPYITQLENAVNRMATQLVDVKAKLAECERLANENRHLKAQNQRLIAEKVATH